jgi:peroxiredoxin
MTVTNPEVQVSEVFSWVRSHDFHPLDDDRAFTQDRHSMQHGIADLNNNDWKMRLLAVRDLVRAGADAPGEVEKGLMDTDETVRYLCATALGVLGSEVAVGGLEQVVRGERSALVRSQAVIALGQIESTGSLELLRERLTEDPSRDVRHQCELAIDQIEKRSGRTGELLTAFQTLDEEGFEVLRVGSEAPDFKLPDTEDTMWRLSDLRGESWVVLIWIFADWCPVCHREFSELMEMRSEFENEGVQVFSIECHDRYRGRVMVGKELEPSYWFAKRSFKEAYSERIWWPHLLDRAGAVGAMYGVDPLAFAVHAEYINRPTTVIIDPDGIVKLAYYGTFWGDRPTIEQTLEMIRSGRFDFEHPDRRKVLGTG